MKLVEMAPSRQAHREGRIVHGHNYWPFSGVWVYLHAHSKQLSKVCITMFNMYAIHSDVFIHSSL